MKNLVRASITLALVSSSAIAFAQEKQPDPTPPQSTWGTGQQALPPMPADDSADAEKPADTEPAPATKEPKKSEPAIRYVPASHPYESTAPAPEQEEGVPPLQSAHDTRESFWKVSAGVRGGRIDDPGYDPFADNSQLWQFSFAATRTLLTAGRFSFAAGLGWDGGVHSDTTARGFSSGIAVHRLNAPLEGRFHVATWLYGFARVAPGAVYRKAWIEDPSSPTAELDSSAWAFAADFSLGASFLAGPQGKPDKHVPRFWFTPEIGYAWSGSTELTLAPKGAADDPQPTGTTNLGELALRGPFARMSVDLSF